MKYPFLAQTLIAVSAVGCTVFDERLHDDEPNENVEDTECETHQECTDKASEDGDDVIPSICVQPEGRCEPLLSEDCDQVTGDYLDDNAVFIASMFSTQGNFGFSISDAMQRQNSAILAVEQINGRGGVPGADGELRPLVMVSCDDSIDLLRAGTHLVENLRVPAIVGPTASSFTIRLTQEVTAQAGVALLTPTAGAAAIADLNDNGLTFQMVPNDGQRGVVMIDQINTLEATLREDRERDEIRLAILFRDDALGQGTRAALDALELNGEPLANTVNLGTNVRIDGYAPMEPNWEELVEAYLELLPDMIVIGGVADTVAGVILPLEERWPAEAPRPYYLGIDAMQSPPLLDAAGDNDDLRRRIRGTGVTQAPESVEVNNSFRIAYSARFSDTTAFVAGMGPAYDATYAIAYALAATAERPVSGPTIVDGLAQLSGGSRRIQIDEDELLGGFSELTRGNAIDAIGTIGILQWNQRGSMLGGAVEVWCIGIPGDDPVFQPSGLTYNLTDEEFVGEYMPCAP